MNAVDEDPLDFDTSLTIIMAVSRAMTLADLGIHAQGWDIWGACGQHGVISHRIVTIDGDLQPPQPNKIECVPHRSAQAMFFFDVVTIRRAW